MKTLVAGWFSFEQGHATAGDLMVRDVACQWLQQAGYHYDIAMAQPFAEGIDWRQADPDSYSHVIFVCGPFTRSDLEVDFLEKFGHSRLIGLNLSMQIPLAAWNPFDLLLERDSSEGSHPDMAFLAMTAKVPVVGVCLVESYPGAFVNDANERIRQLIDSQNMAVLEIDTRLDKHSTNHLRNPSEVEALIGRVDVLLTTRLHGLVLALKNGVPPLVIDPEAGGAKIRRQAELLDWPACFVVDDLDDKALQKAFQYCLTDAARHKARHCFVYAQKLLFGMREKFITELQEGTIMDDRFIKRLETERQRKATMSNEHQEMTAVSSPLTLLQKLKKLFEKI